MLLVEGAVLNNLYIAGDLAGLLLTYMDKENIELSDLRAQLHKYNTNTRMSHADWWQALEQLRDSSAKPHVGLEIGACIAPAYCGVIGYLCQSCDTAWEALIRFERYQRLLYDGTSVSIEGHQGYLRLSLDLASATTRESVETLLASLLTYSRLLTGRNEITFQRIGFTHAKPENTQAYEDFFNCPLEFNCPKTFIEGPTEYAALPIKQGEPALKALLDQQATVLMENISTQDSFIVTFHKLLLGAIQAGEPTLDKLSCLLSISASTLRRRLKERGVNFNDLLAQQRYQLAKQYLTDNRLTLSEITLLLGYSEQSAFSRAFKQWSNRTPLQWQKIKSSSQN